MPKVPRAPVGQVPTRGLPQNRVVTGGPIEAFGGGRERVTRAATNLVDTVGNLVQSEIDKSNKARVITQSEETRKKMNELLKGQFDEQGNAVDPGYLNQRGIDAFEKKQNYIDNFNKLMDETTKSFTNGSQRQMWVDQASRISLDFNNSIQNHESREYQAKTEQDFRASVANINEDIASNFLEPNKIDEGINRLQQTVIAFSDVKGLGPEARKQALVNAESGAHQSVIIQNLNNNRDDVAQEYFNRNKSKMTVDDAQRVNQLFKRKDAKLTQIRSRDPWEYFAEVGELKAVKGFVPVDFSSADSLEQRNKFVNETSKKNNFNPDKVTFLNQAEEAQVIETLNGSNSVQATSLMRDISLNAEPEVMVKISDQIFKNDPGLGIAMSISKDDFEAANQIVAGRRLLIDDKIKGTATGQQPALTSRNSEVIEAFDAIVENSISDKNLRVRMREAVYAHYFKGQFDANENLSLLDEDKFRESFDVIQGEMAEINDQRTFSFRLADKKGQLPVFVEPDELEDTVHDFNDESFQATHNDVPRTVDGQPFDIEKANDRVKLITYSDGKYQMQVDDKILLNKDGTPFIVDMKKMVKYRRKNTKSFGQTVSDFFKGNSSSEAEASN